MSRIESVHVPDIGDFDTVDVVEVLVAVGDQVEVEDALITLESDKASLDVPSPLAGKVQEIAVRAGDRVGEGALILALEVSEEVREAAAPEAVTSEDGVGEAAEATASGEADDLTEEPPAVSPSRQMGAPQQVHTVERKIDEGAFATAYASPAVRRFSRELGVDLGQVKGSGRKGRILKEDVQTFVKQALANRPASTSGFGLPEMPVIDFAKFGEIERQPLTRIQKISGPVLHRSWLHVAHVTQHDEADITELEAFRQENKAKAKEQGFSLTPLAFVMKAAVAALEEYPKVNASLDPDGEHLILKKYFHIGIAVDTPDGLVVPVIRDVDRKGIFDLAQELGEVSARARQGKLGLNEIRGASFTITSLGGIGGTAFTPIVNAPEVAILGVSRSQLKPVWQDGEFVPRLMLPLSLSYDHRVVDGALGVRFTTYLCEVLADIKRVLL
jgi:pyruvate dehydrogenase E2 component (dihydrolipoamide acetyltransferase)